MSNFTYEHEEKKEIFETYEWDNLWIEYANDSVKRRVLYIGDSISCATRRAATLMTKDEILFDGFGTSKGLDNPYFKDSIALFSMQLPKIETVLFNNGLHGWHLDDETEYVYHFEEMIKFLLEKFKEVPLYIVLSTHLENAEREERIKKRNAAAQNIAKKYELGVIDLYQTSIENKDKIARDGVHYLPEGYDEFAKKIIDSI